MLLDKQAIYPLWWLSLTKNMQTEQLLCWTDTKHSATSSSNEEEHKLNLQLTYFFQLRVS